MTLADLSIKRPTFITCVVLVMIAVGLFTMRKMGVDLFPNVTFPVVVVSIVYPGAGPTEIETLVTKPMEDEISTLSGLKRITSTSSEGISTVVAQFGMEVDVKFAEQEIRDRVGATKTKFPADVKEPIIRRIDPADMPVVVLALDGQIADQKLFDLADQVIRPRLEQVNQVGFVEIVGGRKREIHVDLDRAKLKNRELSVTMVSRRLAGAGENIPSGKVDQGSSETVFRTLGEFKNFGDISRTVLSFYGNEVPTTVADVGVITDSVEDEKTRAFVNGKKALFLNIFRQSGANTIAVVDGLKKRINQLNEDLKKEPGAPKLTLVRDGSTWIHVNVEDVKESIFLGILLAVIVVFLFLGNARSTIITGLALPNSLIGAFVLMYAFGFTINIMTLLALSLSIGLLVDDAIVVRENIFRHIEMGKSPLQAAKEGTLEVTLAVIATTLTVIAVFGPVGFLKGVVGQFFKEFGMTVCFAMAISLFDALTIAPMLSAYFAGSHNKKPGWLWAHSVGIVLGGFERFQVWLENSYEKLIRFTIRRPLLVIAASLAVSMGSCSVVKFIPKTFLPPQDASEFSVALDMPPGTNLNAMNEVAFKVDKAIRANPEVEITTLSVGSPKNGKSEVAEFYVHLVPRAQRKVNTIQMKEKIREQLKAFAYANPKVKDYDAIGGGQRPFNLTIVGLDQKELEKAGTAAFKILKNNPGLKDVETSLKEGKPELQFIGDSGDTRTMGISTQEMGYELRAQVEGVAAAKFRENGREYDVRVRLQEDQRNLQTGFATTYVPNLNQRLVLLKDVAKKVASEGPATINRQDRARNIMISADIAPGGGMANVMADIDKMFETDVKLPQGLRYGYIGQAEDFTELIDNITVAMAFGFLFIYLVLASLYESFVTPITIMIALPLAFCGSFVGVWLGHESLNIFSMIGIIMLLGVASKNSILLVDYTNQMLALGKTRNEALLLAGKARLRPILMTTMALIAGTTPVALGLNEASKQRTSMGLAIIGGLVSSTLLTLIVVPAAFSFIDRFRVWSKTTLKRIFSVESAEEENHVEEKKPRKARYSSRNSDLTKGTDLLDTP